MIHPIWEALTLTGTSDTQRVRIKSGGETIFDGICKAMPDSNTWELNVNEILKLRLGTSEPDLRSVSSVTRDDEACSTFEVYNVSGDTETLWHTYKFSNNWSYDASLPTGDTSISRPVNGHMDSRMRIMYTAQRDTGGTICYDIR